MALGPRLTLRQGPSLVMTPQLQQAIKLLELPNLAIAGYLAEQLDSNPLLELHDPGGDGAAFAVGDWSGEAGASEAGHGEAERAPGGDPVLLGSALSPGEGWDGVVGRPSLASAGGAAARPLPDTIRDLASPSLSDHLHAQIGLVDAEPRALAAARWLIDQLDEAGYLAVALGEAAASLDVPMATAEAGLALVQSLDPTGVGARSLAECLALQAREADRLDPLMAGLLDNLELLASGALARLKRVCGVDDDDLGDMLAELRGYDPKPGLRFGGASIHSIVPDILVREVPGGGWDIALNPATLPRLVVDHSYYLSLRGECSVGAQRSWLGGKLADANWLTKALDQRQKTILKVAAEVVRRQEPFLRGGAAHLRPLTLRTVADETGMHESTVSRVTSGKYLWCERGTFELKYFFSSRVAAADGEGEASAEAVKAAIRLLVEGEAADAVLSDDALAELLRGHGFALARRTVTKYREAIGFGSSIQRRRQKALAAVSAGTTVRRKPGTAERNRSSGR